MLRLEEHAGQEHPLAGHWKKHESNFFYIALSQAQIPVIPKGSFARTPAPALAHPLPPLALAPLGWSSTLRGGSRTTGCLKKKKILQPQSCRFPVAGAVGRAARSVGRRRSRAPLRCRQEVAQHEWRCSGSGAGGVHPGSGGRGPAEPLHTPAGERSE